MRQVGGGGWGGTLAFPTINPLYGLNTAGNMWENPVNNLTKYMAQFVRRWCCSAVVTKLTLRIEPTIQQDLILLIIPVKQAARGIRSTLATELAVRIKLRIDFKSAIFTTNKDKMIFKK